MLYLLLALLLPLQQHAFLVIDQRIHNCHLLSTAQSTFLLLSSSSNNNDYFRRRSSSSGGGGGNNNNNDNNNSPPRQSRLTGNQRAPSPQELEIMDQMIDRLATAKPYELPAAVQRAFRVISSPQFFLRIAYRGDAATTSQQKKQLAALASNLVSTLEAVVSTTEDRLDERAKEVERVVKAAAEPDSGEFLVPLTNERLRAMRNAMQDLEPNDLDESFLSTVDAWMNKSHDDGMDLMVGILQKVLQIYAGLAIHRAREQRTAASSVADDNNADDDDTSGQEAELVFDQLLQSDADVWDRLLQQSVVSLARIKSVVQKSMETIVLRLNAGSLAQRVQAEYLKEMLNRVEALEKQ